MKQTNMVFIRRN